MMAQTAQCSWDGGAGETENESTVEGISTSGAVTVWGRKDELNCTGSVSVGIFHVLVSATEVGHMPSGRTLRAERRAQG